MSKFKKLKQMIKIILIFYFIFVWLFSCTNNIRKEGALLNKKISSEEEIKKSLEKQKAQAVSSKELKRRVSKLKSDKMEIVLALKKNKSFVGAFPFLIEKEFTYEDDFRNIEYEKITPNENIIGEIAKKINYLPIVKVLERGSDFLITPENPEFATIEIEEKPVYSGKFPLIDFDFLEKENKWVIRTIRYDRD